MPPMTVYYVKVKPKVGPDLSYRKKGGGLYSDRSHAEAKVKELQAFGKEVTLLQSTTYWEEV